MKRMLRTGFVTAVLVVGGAALGQGTPTPKTESAPSEKPAKEAVPGGDSKPAPTEKGTKGAKGKDGVIEPKVAPASLPAGTMGLVFDEDDLIRDAVKLVEHDDADAGEWLLKNALAKGGLTDTRKDEVRLALAMVYIRGGELASVNNQLGKFLSKSKDVEDTSSSDPGNKVRRAQVLDVLRGIAAKQKTKEKAAPLMSGEAWLGALKEAGKLLKTKLETEQKDILRAAAASHWDQVARELEQCREVVEQIDCLRGVTEAELWRGVTEKYASTLTEVVGVCSKRGLELKNSLPGLARNTHLSMKEPGRYWPLGAVNLYNDARNSLDGAVTSGRIVIEHYSRAKSKWNQERAFGAVPGLSVGRNDVPPVRDVALKH